MSKWISVEDRNPTSLPVLAYSDDWNCFIAYDEEYIYFSYPYISEERSSTLITHWMPLPERPKDK